MEILIVALLLFAGMIVSWCMLPGGKTSTVRHTTEVEPMPHGVIELA